MTADSGRCAVLMVRLASVAVAAAIPASGCGSDGGAVKSDAAGSAVPAGRGSYPWMVTPIFSSPPMLGTAVGATGAILYCFDEKQRVWMPGMSARFTSTDSLKVALTGYPWESPSPP